MPYSQEQIYGALRKADAAGDAEAVKALLAQMNGGGDGQPRQVVKGQVTWQDGKYQAEYTHDVGANDQQIQQAGYDALAKKYPTINFPKPQEFLLDKPDGWKPSDEGTGEQVNNMVANVTKGLYSVPDMLVQGYDAGRNALLDAGSFLSTGGGASSGTKGEPNSRDKVSNWLQGQKAHTTTMGEMIDRNNPHAQYEPSAVPAQVLGSMAVPIGPKGAAAPKYGYNALARAEAKAAAPVAENALARTRNIPGAQDVVATGQREGVRVMTSNVRPPKTALGKLGRTLGEKIPFAGTAGPNAAQQEERIAAATRLVKEHGTETSDEAVNAVAADLAKTRGAAVQKLSNAKKLVIENTPGAVTAPRAVAEIDKQVAHLSGIDAKAYSAT